MGHSWFVSNRWLENCLEAHNAHLESLNVPAVDSDVVEIFESFITDADSLDVKRINLYNIPIFPTYNVIHLDSVHVALYE